MQRDNVQRALHRHVGRRLFFQPQWIRHLPREMCESLRTSSRVVRALAGTVRGFPSLGPGQRGGEVWTFLSLTVARLALGTLHRASASVGPPDERRSRFLTCLVSDVSGAIRRSPRSAQSSMSAPLVMTEWSNVISANVYDTLSAEYGLPSALRDRLSDDLLVALRTGVSSGGACMELLHRRLVQRCDGWRRQFAASGFVLRQDVALQSPSAGVSREQRRVLAQRAWRLVSAHTLLDFAEIGLGNLEELTSLLNALRAARTSDSESSAAPRAFTQQHTQRFFLSLTYQENMGVARDPVLLRFLS